jgi:hypothetical protein
MLCATIRPLTHAVRRRPPAAALVAFLCLAGSASAGTITYTYHTDDGGPFSGSVTVDAAAIGHGQINPAEVKSFAFQTPFGAFDSTSPTVSYTGGGGPIPINALGNFTADPGPFFEFANSSDGASLFAPADKLEFQPFQERIGATLGAAAAIDFGHWSQSLAATAVPEPATLTLTAVAGLIGLGCAITRRRRRQPRAA